MPKQNILITGASGGIGKAIIEKFSLPNTNLIITGRNENTLSQLKESIEKHGGSCHLYRVDLSETDEVQSLCTHVQNNFQSIDWIIHCAGYIEDETLSDTNSISVFKKTFAVNTFSIIQIQSLLGEMITEHGGSIIVSSTAGIWGNAQYSLYAASKSAATNYGKSLAHIWEGTGKKSFIICPGPTNTAMRARIAGDAEQHQKPEKIADVIQSVISEPGKYKNGSVLVVRNSTTAIIQEETLQIFP